MFTCLDPGKLELRGEWSESARLAAEVGYAGVELPHDLTADAQRYGPTLERLGLRAGGCNLDARRLQGDQDDFERYVGELPKLARMLSELGGPRTTTFLRPWSETLAYREHFDFQVERFKRVTGALAQHEVSVSIAFVGPRSVRVGHTYSFIHTLETMLAFLDAVGPGAKLLLDAWHWHASLGTVSDLKTLGAEDVGYVHLNDAPQGVPIEHLDDHRRELPATTGIIDIGAVVAQLKQIDYDGPLIPDPFDRRLAQLAPEDSARRGLESLKRLANVSARETA